MGLLPNKRKRFKFAIYTMHVFILIGIYAIRNDVDLTALGVYLGATAIPLVAYILGDSLRKSDE